MTTIHAFFNCSDNSERNDTKTNDTPATFPHSPLRPTIFPSHLSSSLHNHKVSMHSHHLNRIYNSRPSFTVPCGSSHVALVVSHDSQVSRTSGPTPFNSKTPLRYSVVEETVRIGSITRGTIQGFRLLTERGAVERAQESEQDKFTKFLEPFQPNMFPNLKNLKIHKGFEEDPTQYLETYFRIAYYLCAVPFRFTEISSSSIRPLPPPTRGLFVLKKSVAQQVMCYVTYLWCLYKYIPSFNSTKFNSPRIFSFDLVALLTSFGVRASYIYAMTRKQAEILAILNFLREDQLIQRKSGSQKLYSHGKVRWMVGSVSLFYTLIGLVYITGVTFGELWDWSPRKVWATYAGQTRFNAFLLPTNQAPNFEELSAAEHVATALFVVLKALNLIGSHCVGNCFLVVALLFHHLARDFQALLKEQPEGRDGIFANESVIRRFWRLRLFIKCKVNGVFGVVLVLWMMEAIFYYSCYLDSIFNETNHLSQIRNIIYLSNFLAVLLIAADAHYKVSAMKDWIMERQERMRLLSESELVVILNALSPSDVGLKAFGFFTVTYEFITTITHVIITYAVIFLNFGDGSEPLSLYGYNNII